MTTDQPRVRFTKHNSSIHGAAFSPGDGLVASCGGRRNDIYLWKTNDGSLVQHLSGKGRAIWSCGWSPDGQSVAWGNSNIRRLENDCGPLEYSFHLSDLQLGGTPDASFRRASMVWGPLSLERKDLYHINVKRAGEVITTMAMPEATDNRVLAYTFLSADRAVMSSRKFLSLYDTHTGGRIRDFPSHTGNGFALAPSPDGRYFLYGPQSQILRVFSPDHRKPLLSLFFAGNDWIAWTEEGYYAASAGGERLMGWQVNNGADKMASFYPAGRFRKSLYRPDLVKLLLPAGSTPRGLELADQRRGRSTQATSVDKTLPPAIVITAPSQAALRITQPVLDVTAGPRPWARTP